MKTVAVSGGFDPLHVGHVRLMQEARKLGDRLVVIVNNDNWLKNKKGYAFMPEEERKEIIEALECVDEVVLTKHPKIVDDTSVSNELREVAPDVFAQGGDRKEHNTPEDKVCDELGIEIVYNVGGGKVQSSSELVKDAKH